MEEIPNICVRREKNREEKRKLIRKMFKERMTESFPKLVKHTQDLRISWNPNNINTKKINYKRNIIEKLLKTSQNLESKEREGKTKKKKNRQNNQNVLAFSEGIMEAKDNIMNFQVLQKRKKKRKNEITNLECFPQ